YVPAAVPSLRHSSFVFCLNQKIPLETADTEIGCESLLRRTVCASLPSLDQSPHSKPSYATNRIPLPKGVSVCGCKPVVGSKPAFTRSRVPAAVPSDVQVSVPCSASTARKRKRSLTTVAIGATGFATFAVPSRVPSLDHHTVRDDVSRNANSSRPLTAYVGPGLSIWLRTSVNARPGPAV